MSNEKTNKDKKVSIVIKGEIDLPQFDPEPYIGKSVMIDEVNNMQGAHGYYVLVKALVEPKCEALNDEPLYASRILGLQEDKEGNIGYGKETKTAKFLERMKVKSIEALKGEFVKVQRKGESSYLTF